MFTLISLQNISLVAKGGCLTIPFLFTYISWQNQSFSVRNSILKRVLTCSNTGVPLLAKTQTNSPIKVKREQNPKCSVFLWRPNPQLQVLEEEPGSIQRDEAARSTSQSSVGRQTPVPNRPPKRGWWSRIYQPLWDQWLQDSDGAVSGTDPTSWFLCFPVSVWKVRRDGEEQCALPFLQLKVKCASLSSLCQLCHHPSFPLPHFTIICDRLTLSLILISITALLSRAEHSIVW